MAGFIEGNVYRVSLDSERNHIYVQAESEEDLIRFLVDECVGKHSVFGVKEAKRDGTLATVNVLSSSIFQTLSIKKMEEMDEEKATPSIQTRKLALDALMNEAREKCEMQTVCKGDVMQSKSL